MRNKTPKRQKPSRSPGRHAKPQSSPKVEVPKKSEFARNTRPWLRMISSDGELEPERDSFRGLFALTNGRRQSPEPEPRPSKKHLRRH